MKAPKPIAPLPQYEIPMHGGDRFAAELEEFGYSLIPKLLNKTQCAQLTRIYDEPDRFRNKIIMARHQFGQGEYQYFSYPLPPIVQELRVAFYRRLVAVARDWAKKMNLDIIYPDELEAFLAHCREQGQRRPTALMLRYGLGDYNRLHQDLYGDVVFPLQLAVCLSEPGQDITGGEFILTEQRARVQTRAEVVPLGSGDVIVFANSARPVPSARGYSRAQLRHGVSRIRSGTRHCLGVIFHDSA